MAKNDLHGVLVIDKPQGPTSARVVAAVRKRLGVKKIGHTGTLDPMATGVLPMCIGRATKIAGLLLAEDKAYTGEVTFGIETDTLDREGTVVGGDLDGATTLDRDRVTAAIAELVGDIEQVPPMYSALRVDGVRLHTLARAGEVVEREARPVRVDRFELESFEAGDAATPPRARIAVECSKGTYIRCLARDLGAALGCGAHLSALRRTRAGAFTIDDAITLDELTLERALGALLPPARVLAHLPAITVGPELVGRVSSGLQLRWEQVSSGDEPSARFCILDPDGRLLAVAQVDAHLLAYDRVFPAVLA